MGRPKKDDKVHIVRTEHVLFFTRLFEGLNIDLLPLLRETRVPNTLIDQPEYLYLPESTLKNLLQKLGQSVSISEYGLRVWEMCSVKYVPSYLEKLEDGVSLKACLTEFGELLKRESSNTKVYVKQAGGSWWLVREKSGVEEVWFKYAEMFSVLFMVQLLKQLTHGQYRPTEIGVQSNVIDDFLKLPELHKVRFYSERPVTALKIDDELIEQLVTIGKKSSEPNEFMPTILSFTQSLKLALSPYFTAGKLPLDMASDITNIHSRTIQRRLREEGTNYKEFSEEILFALIKNALTRSHNVSKIAQQFGYSDCAHFTRAFKRYEGVTPSQYRASIDAK